jgi:hypothetical protein
MLRVDPQRFVSKFMKPMFADDSWKLLFKTESIRLKKFPDYYPLYQDALLEQTASHARLGESFASTRARLKDKLPPKLDGFVPGYKPLKLLAQTLVWRVKTPFDFFSYLCHGNSETLNNCGRQQLVLAGCKEDYIDRKTPRGRIRLLLRNTGVVGCNNVNTIIKNDNLFGCDVTYPDFTPRLRVKSPLVAGNWFYAGVDNSRIYALVVHVPHKEKIHKVELIIDGKRIDMTLAYENGVSKVYYVTYKPMKHIPSNMKGYFFHAEINDKHFFYPAQFYYDWQENIKLDTRQRFDGNCKVPFPDRTCEVCEFGYRNVDGSCVKCNQDNCEECNEQNCLRCNKGYLLEYGKCDTKCIENCDRCSTKDKCDICTPTHFLNYSSGICIPCNEKFHDCATCTNDKCLTYICQHQDPDCDRKYTPGLYYSNVTDKCEKCSRGCKHCEPDEHKGSICEMCNDGLFLTREGECIPCHYVEGCISGQCDGYKCLKCKKGYYPKGKGCAKCEDSCSSCEENGKCVDCVDGYYLDLEYGKCLQVFEPENCETKDDKGLCAKCKKGYGFDRFRKCVKCDASCKECSENADKCTACKDTFFLQNEKCVACSTRGCDLCDEQQCFSCLPNSYLHNGVCIRGPPGCSLCHNNAPVCRVCEKGMKMEKGHCVPDCDIKNCAKCNGDETCRYCKSTLNPFAGYEPAPNGSEPCPFVCDPAKLNCVVTERMRRGEIDVCFSLGCKYCPPHTFRKNFKCEKCGTGCDNCLNEKECLKCLPGFVYYKGECFKQQCNGTCGEGEFLANCTCAKCEDKYEHCAACGEEECNECKPNFYLAENKTMCLPCTKSKCKPKPRCHGDDCKKPVDPDCPPCDDCIIPDPEPTPEPTPECPKNMSKIGDEYLFDPQCIEIDEECYCKKCACGYRLNEKHVCDVIPEIERAQGDRCCSSEDGCCLECEPGYELNHCKCEKKCECGKNADGSCVILPYKENATIINCSYACFEGFVMINETCLPCGVNMTKCSEPNECEKCDNGNYCNPETKKCEECLVSNCTGTCDETGNVCIECAKGDYLNETSGECMSCPNCKECMSYDNTVYCTVCNDDSVPVNGKCNNYVSFTQQTRRNIISPTAKAINAFNGNGVTSGSEKLYLMFALFILIALI